MEFSVEFIGHVIELMIRMEKTGLKKAFMFQKLLQKIRDGKDMSSILSTASFGRKKS